MAKYASRADLLIAAGESIKMQTAAGIEPVQKYGGSIIKIIEEDEGAFYLGDKIEMNEFPLAVVEGKPVFVGDELYNSDGERFIVGEHRMALPGHWSWNPPKPKTVMVELPITVVEWYAKYIHGELTEPCRKALEKA